MAFFYKIGNGLAPKYLTNYLNTNDNPVHKTRASKRNNVKRFGKELKISNNHFFLSVSINGTN